MPKATIQLETIGCPSCVQKIEKAVKAVDGVDRDSVEVLFNASKVKVNFDENKISVKDIEDAITRIGYDVKESQVK